MKIWFLYLLKNICKNFISLLCLFFLMYCIVDLSIHGVRFFSYGSLQGFDILTYYLFDFLRHIEFFFPFTFLLVSLKVLLDLNSHHEWVALQIAGLSQKKLLSPFFTFALFLTLISYANQEWIAPHAQESAEMFRNQHAKKKTKKSHVYSIDLQDKTELVYQSFDPALQEFQDVFWIQSPEDLWHMKSLKVDQTLPTGRYADHFQRNKENLLEKTESFSLHKFPQLLIESTAAFQTFIPFENRPLSTLIGQSFKPYSERPVVISHLHYKIATGMLSLLVLIAIAPTVLQYKRHKPTFLIVAISLLLFIAFTTILQGMLILGENQVISGTIAIWTPFVFIASLCTLRFARI